jgi:hypothetical protein
VFAAVKRSMQRRTVFTPSDLVTLIQQISSFSVNCMSAITTYDLRTFLTSQYHRSIPVISSMHHWHFERTRLNAVTSRSFATDKSTHTDLSCLITQPIPRLDQYVLSVEGLSDTHRQELRENMSAHLQGPTKHAKCFDGYGCTYHILASRRRPELGPGPVCCS